MFIVIVEWFAERDTKSKGEMLKNTLRKDTERFKIRKTLNDTRVNLNGIRLKLIDTRVMIGL